MQLLWAIAQFLVSDISPIYLVDEFVSLLQVLPKEIRMLVESKILYFLFQVVGLSSVFSCVNLELESFSSEIPGTGRYLFNVRGELVDYKANGCWSLFYWKLMLL